MVSVYQMSILLANILVIAEHLLSSYCCGALIKTCPDGVCKNGNCTAGANSGDKIHCRCYNVGSGEICDPKIDANNCKVLQCLNGLCKLNQEQQYYCECLVGWESTNCNVTVQLADVKYERLSAKRKATCPAGSYMCPSGECSRWTVTNCDGVRDCEDGSDEACDKNGSYYKNPEDIRYQRNNLEKDVRSTNTGGQVNNYAGIMAGTMVGSIGVSIVLVFLFTKVLKNNNSNNNNQRHPYLFSRSYFRDMHAAQLQDEEHLSRRRALREAQAVVHTGGSEGCDCTAAAGSNCLLMGANHRLTVEDRIHLTDICYGEERASNLSETSANLDPPPVYADIVSERVSFLHRCETPPPAYEDLVF